MSSSAPAVKHILPPALSQGRQCLAALESRSDYPVIHHVTLTPGAQWSEVKTSSRWYNAGPAMSANHLSHSLRGGDRFFFFFNSTHSVQERLGGCVSPGAMASVTHARTHLWYADTLCRGLKEEKWRSFTVWVCEETSREVKGGIVILVVPKVTSEDKQENREREKKSEPQMTLLCLPRLSCSSSLFTHHARPPSFESVDRFPGEDLCWQGKYFLNEMTNAEIIQPGLRRADSSSDDTPTTSRLAC